LGHHHQLVFVLIKLRFVLSQLAFTNATFLDLFSHSLRFIIAILQIFPQLPELIFEHGPFGFVLDGHLTHFSLEHAFTLILKEHSHVFQLFAFTGF
jgi:hypothetical protein